MSPLILIVDDCDFTAIYLEGLIGDQYRIRHCTDGESGVAAALAELPSVVLMDVEMPGMDGYTACRLLKDNPVTRDVPVIFVSARVGPADRLAGYEAGGEDYIAKPFEPDELTRKIDVLLRNHRKNRELTQRVQWATDAAMTAMSNVGDSGIIMRLLAEMMASLDFLSVADCIMRSMEAFELDVSLQLRGDDETLSWSREGVCSPLEESVLGNMASCARIVDLGARSAFNYPRVSIIVRNMPRWNPEHYGRVKDNLAKVAEAVDVHLQSLGRVKSALRRGDKLLDLLQRNMDRLQEIESRYRTQRAASSQILNSLVEDIERSFVSLGLTEAQERDLQERVRNAIDEAQSLYDQEVEADGAMRSLTEEFNAVLAEESREREALRAASAAVPQAVAAADSGDSSIELF